MAGPWSHGIMAALAARKALRNFALALIVAFALPSLGAAQGVQPFPEDQGGLWETALNVSGGPPAAAYAGSPTAACQIQHQEFNPGATYLPPNYVDADSYNCNWDQISGPAPGSIRFVCGPGFSPVDGKCLYLPAQSVECACEPGGKPQSAPDTPTAGNPISITSGYKVIAERDYESADGLLAVERSFVSRPGDGWKLLMPGYLVVEVGSTAIAFHSITGGYDDFVPTDGNPATWTYTQPNFFGDPLSTSRHRLSMVTTPTVDRPSYFADTNVDETDPAEVRLDKANGEYILFRRVNIATPASGQRILVPVEAGQPGGYTRWFDYADDGPFPYRVRDSFDRALLLEWDDTDGSNVSMPFRLTKAIGKITLPDGTRLEYDYDRGGSDFVAPAPTWAITAGLDVRGVSSGNINYTIDAPKDRLRSVTRRSAANAIVWKRSYDYQNGFQPNNLTAIRDQNNVVRASYTYAGFGKLASSQRAGGVAPYSYEHLEVLVAGSPDNRQQVRRVTGPLGRRDDYLLYRRENAARIEPWAITSVEGQATATTPADSRSFAYDSSFGIKLLKSGMTDARGTLTSYSNDLAKGRPTAITEAVGTAEERSTTILWHAMLDLPTQVDVPGLRTNYTYDASGQLLTRTLTDTTTHTLPYVTAGQTRAETYTWGAGGRLASVNGPRAAVGSQDDITGFTYDATGNLLTMTNALGHVTTFASYDANGRPGSMTDPNGAVTLFAYDALGRLVSTNRKDPASPTLDAITAYEYDVEGRATGITLPGTQKMIFGYNLAGQLLQVSSADGEKWRVQRDAMGNITQEKIKTSAGTDRSTITSSFDSLGRMLTETLGPGRTTAWDYDKNGNPVRTTSPRSHATDMAFDPLNRLISTLAPDSGTNATGYDAKDDIAAFTDAASVETTFVRNGFGEVIRETSPDRGTSIYEYDSAGNLAKATDGRGQVIHYSYDILNRLTQKIPVGRPASEIVGYTYDSNTLTACWCVGRLATMTDAGGTTRFGYDHRGNFLGKNIVGTTLGTLSFKYDLADRIVQTRLPSLRFVAYTRDDKGRVIRVETRPTNSSPWTLLADDIAYEPLGPMKSADLGNGLKLALDWGSDRRLASKRLYTAAGTDVWHVSYGYDADDNIVAITDLVNPANSLTFGYDSVDRLTRMDGSAGAFARQDFLHDANGNRTAVERRANIGDLTPAESDTYTKASGTNRLASVAMPAGTRSFAHDARGNLTGEVLPGGGTVTLTYDGHARLTSYAATGAPGQAMTYNGFDERTRIVTTPAGGGAADTRHFAYDQHHRLIGEYGATTADLRAEHIWLLPELGGASPFGGDDGLGGYMPLAVLTTAGGATAIHWVQGNHLGTPVAVTDASGAVVTPSGYSMAGFPGQVRQHAELYYNYYRDYDVSLGRYVQADPIGLDGDANPFLYAAADPLGSMDANGLRARREGRPPVRGKPIPFLPPLVPPLPVFLDPNGPGLSPSDIARLRREKALRDGQCPNEPFSPYIPPLRDRDPGDDCDKEYKEEMEYCSRKFGSVRDQYILCSIRASENLSLCKSGRPSVGWWRDVHMDGVELPRRPKKKRRR
jgi:RHS repeat-associated protein